MEGVSAPSMSADETQSLAVVLHDLAWLLPRTVGPDAERDLGIALPASELEIMRLLVREPGLTVGEVARELALQQTNVSTAVRTLVARGLLAREREPADGRLVRLVPTARAAEHHDACERAWGRVLAGHLRDLLPEERRRVLGCAAPLQALAAVLTAR